MGKDDLNPMEQSQEPLVTRSHRSGTVAATALAMSAFAAFLVSGSGCGGQPAGTTPVAKSPPLFQDWPANGKPDVVLVLTGEQIGYPLPCGCSKPQLGGLDRRYNFLQSLVKERGWKYVAADLGDLAQQSGPQALVKYRYLMEGLKLLHYAAIGVGENEMRMPLGVAIGDYALNNDEPLVLAANLKDRLDNFPKGKGKSSIETYRVTQAKGGGPKVGVVGVVGPSVASAVKKHDLKFDSNTDTLPTILGQLRKEGPELLVLLYQGKLQEAKSCAERFPEFNVVLCRTLEEEPPANPERVGNTLIVNVGHKGRYIGLVGAYRSGNPTRPFDLHYQLVAMSEEYETPPGVDDSPVFNLLEEYTKEVKAGNYLAQYAGKKVMHPIQLEPAFKDATYVGSEKCKGCHEDAYKVWKDSPHSHAYDSLVKSKRPSLRQYDGECVSCHVTGFDFKGGYSDEKATPNLKDNGCENCHGPGSIHVKGGPRGLSPRLLELMNPHKTKPNETEEAKKIRINGLDRSCQKCHDIDNDVHWKIEKWEKIAHPTPKDGE